ncbi:MAG: FAD-dependent oxidoreductase [Armatimonadota bacterium]|nr:FAD-dependent oxidoreductase [Armatimonadota bacterium]
MSGLQAADSTDKYYVEIPDYDYWKRQIECQYACPVHTDARGYIRAIADGDYEAAYRIARGPNPLASMCGRVCGAPCQAACRRGSLDAPLAIRALKRVVMERFGPESKGGRDVDFPRQQAAGAPAGPCLDSAEVYHLLDYLKTTNIPKPTGERVAIIGSGPAGLAAAHDLALLGFRPTIFEMEPVPAGMLYLGVPEYRLPRDLIRAEVAVIEALGAEIRCNTQVGKDVSLAELRNNFAAVIIAVGAKRSRQLDIPGATADGVLGGIDFLHDVALGNPPKLGARVVVVGGGSVAYDVSRTALRQEEADVSRTALRQPSVREVHLCCLESREEMPADETEVFEGDEEGIQRRNSLGPKEILVETHDGRQVVKGVLFQRCLSVFDENGRFAPKFDENDFVTIDADTVILAIGQATDLSFVNTEADSVELNERGQLKVDLNSLSTTAPGVFAAGDVAYGTKLMIDAIASGKKAALSVYEYITGKKISAEQAQVHFPLPDYEREAGYERLPAVKVPTSRIEERITCCVTPVEIGYSEEDARLEASRCLDCGINTIFNGDKCILCNGCVDVCPTLCLKIVPVSWLAPTPDVEAAVQTRYSEGEDERSAIIKDETLCIRCALCAERCPTGAITMERFQFAESWR